MLRATSTAIIQNIFCWLESKTIEESTVRTMKLSATDQTTINDFMRNYVDKSFTAPMNAVRLSADHTDAHRRTIFEVCNTLLSHNIPFFTEVRLKCGTIPDIVCPTHIVPFIEVLSSETQEMFEDLKLHKYPEEFSGRYSSGRLKSFIMIDAQKTFLEEMIF